jgi:hypothetical protein
MHMEKIEPMEQFMSKFDFHKKLAMTSTTRMTPIKQWLNNV